MINFNKRDDCWYWRINAEKIAHHGHQHHPYHYHQWSYRIVYDCWSNQFYWNLQWIVWIKVVFVHWLWLVWKEAVFECWKYFYHHHRCWMFHHHVYFGHHHQHWNQRYNRWNYHSVRIRWVIFHSIHDHRMDNNQDAIDLIHRDNNLPRSSYRMHWSMDNYWWLDEDNRWPQW